MHACMYVCMYIYIYHTEYPQISFLVSDNQEFILRTEKWFDDYQGLI